MGGVQPFPLESKIQIQKEVGFFAPAQMKKILAACVGDLEGHLPLVLFCGFAGLRVEEAGRLSWQMVGKDFIRLAGNVTKTGRARLVPLLPNLKAWLALLRLKVGPVVPEHVDLRNAPRKLAKAAGIAWVANGLRHSFGAYRMAGLKNILQVTEEMGNTPAIARKHYVNPMVTPEQGAAWFAITPEGQEKITALPEAATV